MLGNIWSATFGRSSPWLGPILLRFPFPPHLPRKWNSYSSQLCFKNISNVDCLGRRGAALESETRLLLGSPDLARKEAINPFRAQQTKTWWSTPWLRPAIWPAPVTRQLKALLFLLSSKYYTQRNGKSSLLGADLVIFQKLVRHPRLSRLSYQIVLAANPLPFRGFAQGPAWWHLRGWHRLKRSKRLCRSHEPLWNLHDMSAFILRQRFLMKPALPQ